MKVLKGIVCVLLMSFFLSSCGPEKSEVVRVGDSLKSEFGEDAYYTSISFADTHNRFSGIVTNVEVTKEPSSNKMEEWTAVNFSWEKKSDITMEIPEGNKAIDYMFQLGDLVKISTLDSLFTDAQARLKKEKDIDSRINLISITAPDDGDFGKMLYGIYLEPDTGGTTFRFSYNLDGTFESMDYN